MTRYRYTRPALPPGEHLINPRNVDPTRVYCPTCQAEPGHPCRQPDDWKPHLQRRLNAYATARHLALTRPPATEERQR